VIPAQESVSAATLRRRANAKWRAFQAAKRARLLAELAEHDRHSDENARDLEFALSEERSARTAWRKAEESARAAAGQVSAVAGARAA
jgi:hypothetical protein